jgi:hypothetical protein
VPELSQIKLNGPLTQCNNKERQLEGIDRKWFKLIGDELHRVWFKTNLNLK